MTVIRKTLELESENQRWLRIEPDEYGLRISIAEKLMGEWEFTDGIELSALDAREIAEFILSEVESENPSHGFPTDETGPIPTRTETK